MKIKKIIMGLLTLFVLSSLLGCSTSDAAIQKAIERTQEAKNFSESDSTTNLSQTLVPTATFTATPTPGLTIEQKNEISRLELKLDEIGQQISDANKENEEYSGGLIKTYIEVRIQLYEINKALVEQQIIAIESGTQTSIEITGLKPEPEKLDQLLADIEAQKIKNDETRTEIAKYSGGLIKATYQSALATGEYTLSLLEHQYFLAKYGRFPSN